MTLKPTSRIAILGFGIEGRSVANHLRTEGFTDITICDVNENLQDKPRDLKYSLGETYLDNLTEFDVIFRSPGLPFATPEIQHAAKNHVTITSVTKYFFDKCPCKIVGVTGTKGKGTTCTLLYEMLKAGGHDAYLGGNIGNSPLDFLPDLRPESIVVMELGHCHAEDLHKGPDIGIIIGVTEDHLDYHPDVATYRAAKHPLIANQKKGQKAIINIDYEGDKPFLKLGESKKYHVSTKRSVRRGAYLYKDNLMLKQGWIPTKLIKTSEVGLIGAHNLENILPASLAASILGVSKEKIVETAKAFKGLPHRLELVAEKNGIKFINDSFSTTPLTSIAAMKAFDTPMMLIAGGSEKHADYTEWAEVAALRPNLKDILLIGDTAGRLVEALQKAGYQGARMVKDFDGAFEYVKHNAKQGDTVVLSPACASFDQFENYKKRGEQFKEIVATF